MPKKMEVTAKVPAKKAVGDSPATLEKSATIFVNSGETAAEQIKLFGDEAVKTNADANWVVTLQAAVRRGLATGKTQEQIQAELADAKMGIKTTVGRVDPIQASLAVFKTMTPKERQQYLADLKAAAAPVTG